MYLKVFFGSNKFSLEKIIFLNDIYFLFFFLSNDSFLKNKIKFSFLKLFVLKKNKLYFNFKNFGVYNNLIYYNNYIVCSVSYFEKYFSILSDYGLFVSRKIFNLNYFLFNFHYSLLPFFKGSNPVLGLNYFFNKFFGYTIILLNKYIDNGNIFYFYKLFKKYNFNHNIIKNNFSILSSVFIKFFINNIFYNFLFFFNNLNFYKFLFSLTK